MSVPDAPLLWTVWIASALVWVGLSVIVLKRWRLTQAQAPLIIVGVAVLLRIGVVSFLQPSLSDDIWRYIYDGRTFSEGENPYAHPPQEKIDLIQAEGGEPGWLERLNYPELVTLYQPTSQYYFASMTWLHDVFTLGSVSPEQAHVMFRIGFGLFDIMITLLLMRQLRELGRSPWWAVMWAWNPMVLMETCWSGHQEGLGILALLMALMLGQRASRSWWCAVMAGSLLAVAAGVKPIVLPIALPMAWQLRETPGRITAAAGACIATLGLLYLPFALMDGGLSGMFETGTQFVDRWAFNGSLHPMLERAFGGRTAASIAAGVLLLVVLVVAMLSHRVAWRAATTYLFAMVCLSTTAHPWYLLWALALVPVSWAAARTVVGPAVWVASLTLPWSYVAWLHLAAGGEYQPSLSVQLAVWVPIYTAVVWGAYSVMRSLRKAQAGDMRRPVSGRG